MTIKNPQECLNEINRLKTKFKNYMTEYNAWNTDYTALVNERTEVQNKINLDDQKLFSNLLDHFANSPKSWIRIGCESNRRCVEWCKEKYIPIYITPQGRRLSSIQYNNVGNCGSSMNVIRHCECYIPNSVGDFWNDKNAINAKINYINNDLQPRINAKAKLVPESFNYYLDCCLSDIKCDDGICEGNIQLCEDKVHNQLNATQVSQIELENRNNIIKKRDTILDIQNKIISLEQLIHKESMKVWDFYDKNNIEETINNLRKIYNNVLNNFNKVQNYVFNITQLKNDAKGYYNNTRNESIYKQYIYETLNTINIDVKSINNTINIINDYYNFVKNKLDSVEKDNNDISLLNINKKNILSLIILINNNINNINALYKSSLNFNILSDEDTELLLDMYDNSKKYLDNLIIDRDNINNYYTIFLNIFNKFPKNSDFYNFALLINNELKEKILENNNNIIEVNKTIKNINDIYILKKNLYNAQIIEEEQLLLDASTKKVDENIPINEIQTTPINKKNDENNKTLEIVFIIIGSVFLILLIIYLYKRYRKK